MMVRIESRSGVEAGLGHPGVGLCIRNIPPHMGRSGQQVYSRLEINAAESIEYFDAPTGKGKHDIATKWRSASVCYGGVGAIGKIL
jgi:hypothetical protein